MEKDFYINYTELLAYYTSLNLLLFSMFQSIMSALFLKYSEIFFNMFLIDFLYAR